MIEIGNEEKANQQQETTRQLTPKPKKRKTDQIRGKQKKKILTEIDFETPQTRNFVSLPKPLTDTDSDFSDFVEDDDDEEEEDTSFIKRRQFQKNNNIRPTAKKLR
jgi:hypothetical protein